LSVAFSPDGRYLAAGGNGCVASITLWDLATDECTLRLNDVGSF
jgi:WD40 repeat protein